MGWIVSRRKTPAGKIISITALVIGLLSVSLLVNTAYLRDGCLSSACYKSCQVSGGLACVGKFIIDENEGSVTFNLKSAMGGDILFTKNGSQSQGNCNIRNFTINGKLDEGEGILIRDNETVVFKVWCDSIISDNRFRTKYNFTYLNPLSGLTHYATVEIGKSNGF
jgi:hypothetical protein